MFVGKKGKGNGNEAKNERQTSRSGSRYLLYRANIESTFIHSLLVFLVASSSDLFVDSAEFVWHWGTPDELNYKDFCDAGGSNSYLSCVCLNGNTYIRPQSPAEGSNGYSYYICTEKCDDYPYKANGYCGQCAAGSFFGGYYSPASGNECSESNPINMSPCSCTITTYSQQNVKATFGFDFTCSHDAEQGSPNGNEYNYYGNDIYDIDCNECPAGTYSNQGDMVCSACPVGTYANTAGTPNSCNQCPVGTYTDKNGTTECTPCPAGTFNGNEGSTGKTDCVECQPGYYSSSPGSKECYECGDGEYSGMNATSCTQAEAGRYVGQPAPHNASYPCPIGSYAQKQTGSSYCISCPNGESTNGVGSTSLSDCIECPYGVDSHTYACLNQSEAANLNNPCWEPSQLLSLNASSAVNDLFNLVYDLADVGINSLINDTASVIQRAADGTATFQDIQNILSKLENGPSDWLNSVSKNMTTCVNAVSQELYDEAQSDLYDNTNMFQYQFNTSARERTEWIATWKCSGATFGCTSNNCPQAESCFNPLHQYYASLLSFPGGTPFGNYPHLITGRYTPMYSPKFISDTLINNVQSLVNWENTAKSFQLYYGVIEQIQASEEFTANAIDATLQVKNVSTSVSLSSSYTNGKFVCSQYLAL